jgi:hypothetical protein
MPSGADIDGATALEHLTAGPTRKLRTSSPVYVMISISTIRSGACHLVIARKRLITFFTTNR